jgi:PAS domain S-box-containing protein
MLDSNRDFLVENWLGLDGIPESSVLCLAQTPDGYIWIGSYDGLLRFNGIDFTPVTLPAGTDQLQGIIVCLSTDASGRLWASSETGIMVCDKGVWRAIAGTNAPARSFAEDGNGTMFLGTFDGHVFTVKDSRIQSIEQPRGLYPSGVFCMKDSRDGGLWLANRGFIGRREGGHWKRFGPADSVSLPLLAAPAQEGGIWTVSKGELRRYRADGSITTFQGPDVPNFRQMMEDPSGVIWIASTSDGLTRLIRNGSSWELQNITVTNGLAQNSVWSILTDMEGNYWAGASSGGLHRFSPRQFVNIGLAQGLPDNVVRGLAEIAPGRILAGTFGGDAAEIVDGRVVSVHPAVPGINGSSSSSLLKDSSGRLWIGTSKAGLFVEENGVARPVPMPAVFGRSVDCLMQDGRGRIWVGTEGAVGVIENGVVRALPTNAAALIDNANCMADDPHSGAIWIGTSDRGLFRVSDENFAQVDRIEGLPSDRISSLAIDSDGCVWAGVFGHGLASIEDKKITLFGSEQGLPVQIVASILNDGRGAYWMGTDRGIVRVSREELRRVQKGLASIAAFTLYNDREGVGWGNCTDGHQPSAVKDAYGRLWFATLNGVVMADLSKLTQNTNPPPVVVERVVFADSSGQQHVLLPPFTNSLAMPPGSAELAFRFAVLTFTSPDKVRLSYMMEGPGFGTNWLDLGNRRELIFHTPPGPGTYRLRVKARNNDGVWNQAGASVGFTIEPFFWQTIWFRILAIAGLSGGGGLAAWQATQKGYQRHIDLLEKQRALEHEQARLATIMEATSDLVAFADSEGRLLHVNPAGRKLLGYGAREDVSNLNLKSISPLWAVDRMTRDAVPAARRSGTWEGESALLARDGREIPVSQVIIAHKDTKGEVSFLSTVARDITERKLAEKDNERLLEDLLQSRKMESVGRLAGGIAHDFNNMMQVVLGNTMLALEIAPPDSELYAHLKEIEGSANRSADLTRRLLAFARKQKVQPQVLDLNEAVSGMYKILGRLIGENVVLTWDPAPNLWPVSLDPLQIDQILANLVVNARDAIVGHGAVAIGTANAVLDEASARGHADRIAGEFVLLTVSDTGKGMTPEVVQHIFEPFFTTKDVGRGTGLGLPTVFGIVKQNQGWIEVETEPERGSTFKLFLPRSKSQPLPPAASVNEDDRLHHGTETLLVVEDEPLILEWTCRSLEHCGYTVLSADSPEKALGVAAAETREIHLLVTDVVMPGMSGRDLKEKLQAVRPNLKCVFMSGYDRNVFGADHLRDGRLPFLQKPFTHRELASLVRNQLDGQKL